MNGQEQEINLTLTVDEANTILDALSNMSYKAVYQLIGKIQQQASVSLNQEQETTEMLPKTGTTSLK